MQPLRIRPTRVFLSILMLASGCSPRDAAIDLARDVQESAQPVPISDQADEPAQPAQATLAVAPAIAIDELLPTLAWQDADQFMGQEVFVVGTIKAAGKSKSGHVFLNFGDRRNDLTGFIHRSVVERFETDPKEQFQGHQVRMRGELYRYRGQPNLRINDTSHIVRLPDDTPLPKRRAKRIVPIRSLGDVVTIASYNVLNLFDHVDDPYRHDEGTQSKPRAQMKALAKTIRQVAADILVLAEVENRGYLQQFNDVFLSDLGYRHTVLLEGNDRRGIDVAVLSRLPIGPITSYRHITFPDANGKPMKLRRDLLRVRIEPESGLPFEILAVHLKSKHGKNQGAAIRLGEARMIRRVLDQILQKDADAPFLLCGDFNDTIDSPPLREIVGKGPTKLVSLFHDVPKSARITYNREPYRDMIDFLFASPAMAKRYEADSYTILPGSPNETGSDHNPVSARFRMR